MSFSTSEISIAKRAEESLPNDLLLLADPSTEMISRYLNQSEIFIAKKGEQTIGLLVLKIADLTSEIMNVAVYPAFQGNGIGTRLIYFAINFSKEKRLQKVLIGTADTSKNQLVLYKKIGFTEFHRVKNFFIENYKEPIIENGKRAKDMIRLELSLT